VPGFQNACMVQCPRKMKDNPAPLSRLWRRLALLIWLPVFTLLLGASNQAPDQPVERIRAYTRQIEFDYVTWTIKAAWVKWEQLALGNGRFLPAAHRPQLVLDYLELVRQTQELEAQTRQVYADPTVPDPDAATLELRTRLAALQQQRDRLAPLAESVLQAQVSEVVHALGLSLGGQPIPPVLYHVTAPPNALIVSPRDEIRQKANISILPDMSIEEIEHLEQAVASGMDVSALVVGIGGVGLYPTMVMQTTDINWLAEVVAHEWIHNYLTLRPLGLNYYSSPQLLIINETVATIAGKEIGEAVVARYYPEFLPPPPPDEVIPPDGEQPAEPPEEPPGPPPFDFRAEMRKTRVEAEALLAEGKIEQAELYMEFRRRFLWENGFRIRKLNQAYFSFYGAYADQPGGAAGEDPVSAAVRLLWDRSPSLVGFLNRVAWIWSYEQLQSLVDSSA
jgi:hypothetical protein